MIGDLVEHKMTLQIGDKITIALGIFGTKEAWISDIFRWVDQPDGAWIIKLSTRPVPRTTPP